MRLVFASVGLHVKRVRRCSKMDDTQTFHEHGVTPLIRLMHGISISQTAGKTVALLLQRILDRSVRNVHGSTFEAVLINVKLFGPLKLCKKGVICRICWPGNSLVLVYCCDFLAGVAPSGWPDLGRGGPTPQAEVLQTLARFLAASSKATSRTACREPRQHGSPAWGCW